MLQWRSVWESIFQEFFVEPADDKNKDSAWAYASQGTQLAVTLLLGVFVGLKLDAWKDTSPWFTLAGSALGLLAGLYNFLKRFLTK